MQTGRVGSQPAPEQCLEVTVSAPRAGHVGTPLHGWLPLEMTESKLWRAK